MLSSFTSFLFSQKSWTLDISQCLYVLEQELLFVNCTCSYLPSIPISQYQGTSSENVRRRRATWDTCTDYLMVFYSRSMENKMWMGHLAMILVSNFYCQAILQYHCFTAKLYLTLCDPMVCSLTGSSVHGTFQQEYWSGSPFLFPGDLPDPGIEPTSSALTSRFFTTEPPGKPFRWARFYFYLKGLLWRLKSLIKNLLLNWY